MYSSGSIREGRSGNSWTFQSIFLVLNDFLLLQQPKTLRYYPICKLSLCLIDGESNDAAGCSTVWSRRNIFQSHWFHYVSDSFHINLLQDERRRVVGIATAAAGNELVEPVSFFFPLTRFTPLVPVCKTEDFFDPTSS